MTERKDIAAGSPKDLIEIERKLWTNDPVFYKNSLAKDCLLVFAETGVITRDTAVDAILKENEEGRRWAEVAFDDVRSVKLTDHVASLSYAVTARWEHETFAIRARASSIYIQREDVWRLAFHQQTPINTDKEGRNDGNETGAR